MRYVVAILAAWVFAVLQVSVMPYVEILGVAPDLVLLLAASWVVVRGHQESFVIVPAMGFVRDLITSDPLGTSALALAPIVLFAAAVRLRSIDAEFLPTVLVVASGTLTYGIISMTVLAVTGQTVDWTDAVLRVVLPACLVNAVFTPLVYVPVHLLSAPQRGGVIGTRRLTSPL
jgi:rod shape-determining protein MreD